MPEVLMIEPWKVTELYEFVGEHDSDRYHRGGVLLVDRSASGVVCSIRRIERVTGRCVEVSTTPFQHDLYNEYRDQLLRTCRLVEVRLNGESLYLSKDAERWLSRLVDMP